MPTYWGSQALAGPSISRMYFYGNGRAKVPNILEG
jgi:hypothetical protein